MTAAVNKRPLTLDEAVGMAAGRDALRYPGKRRLPGGSGH